MDKFCGIILIAEGDGRFYFATIESLFCQTSIPSARTGKSRIATLWLRGKMNALTGEEVSYLAGLIDGEGCLTINKYQGKRNRTPSYRGMVIIEMTAGEVFERVTKITGIGKVFYTDHSRDNAHHSASYRWVVYNKADMVALLEKLLPYLVVKKQEAQVLLEFLALTPAKIVGKNSCKSQHYVQRDEQYYQMLKDLKTCGKGISEDRPKIEPAPIPGLQMRLF